jgi:hypothetical protein
VRRTDKDVWLAMKYLRYFLSPAAWMAMLGLRRAQPVRPARRAPATRPTAAGVEPTLAVQPSAKPRSRKWIKTSGAFYLVSATCHVACVLLLLSFPLALRPRKVATAPIIRADADQVPESSHFELGQRPSTAQPSLEPGSDAGGDDLAALSAPTVDGSQVGGVLQGGVPVDLDGVAGAKVAEKSLAAALNWLHRHQESDGRWSLIDFDKHCASEACDQRGSLAADAAATALALLPFFGAGHTQSTAGPHSECLARGLAWLIDHQQTNGDLSANSEQRMYAHALATLALSENYSLSRDRQIGAAAQLAVGFITAAQNKATGGWDYQPGGLGNTSLVAWQVMALRSAERSGLKVNPHCFVLAEKWLRLVADGQSGGLFCYEPGRPVTATMTSVGMLCRQWAGVPGDNPAVVEGQQYLLAHLPASPFSQDVFYWYFGSPALRNLGGSEWQVWFQALRRTLIDTQVKTGCAAGSWGLDPAAPEAWSSKGGRLLATSLAAQLLELEYGQLPLYAPRVVAPVQAAGSEQPLKR